jgi:DNA primase
MNDAKNTRKGRFVRAYLPKPIEYYKTQNINLRVSGAKWQSTICPFHADTAPSLRVNVETGGYKCMSCGARGGDVLDFHQQKYGLGFIDACKQLGAWVENING